MKRSYCIGKNIDWTYRNQDFVKEVSGSGHTCWEIGGQIFLGFFRVNSIKIIKGACILMIID